MVKLGRLAAVGASAAALVVAVTSAPAAAAISPNRIQLINTSSFSAFFVFSGAGVNDKFTTTLVASGTNMTFNVPNGDNAVCVGGQNSSGSTFGIGGTDSVNGSTNMSTCITGGQILRGVKLQVFGSTSLPGWRTIPNN